MQNGLKNARKYFNSIAASAAFLLEYILIKSVESVNQLKGFECYTSSSPPDVG